MVLPFVAPIFGLLIGSFLNVCIVRLPKDESVVTPRSHCPNCGHMIAWYENIPLFSFLFLRGRCRGCGTPISWLYFTIELITGLLFTAMALMFGPTVEFVKYSAFGALMLALTVTDLRDRIIPDELTLTGFCLGVVFSCLAPIDDGTARWLTQRFGTWPGPMISVLDALLGAAVGAGILLAVRETYFQLRHKEGMGFGDVTLMAVIGAFLGAKLAFLTIILGASSGSVVGLLHIALRRRKSTSRLLRRGASLLGTVRLLLQSRDQLPFGSFLGPAAMLAGLWGKGVVQWYLSLL
jgi:leader peptidase (prepilin peptidase)/N-methyltransferase